MIPFPAAAIFRKRAIKKEETERASPPVSSFCAVSVPFLFSSPLPAVPDLK